jgi:uncharacterized protein
MSDALPVDAPPGFHLLAKPTGSTCNIDCTTLFSKEALLTATDVGSHARRVHPAVAGIAPRRKSRWRGKEQTTLMKLEFSGARSSSSKYRRPPRT